MPAAVEYNLAYYLKRCGVASLFLLALAASQAEHPPAGEMAAACVSELELALSANSTTTWQRSYDVEQRSHDLDLARLGVSSVISVQPSYSGERNLAKHSRPADWGVGMQLDANLKYRYDLVDQLQAEAALHKSHQRYLDQRRADVLLALVTFSRLRVAQRAAAAAAHSAVDAEKVLAEAEAASATDDSPAAALDLREASLAARRARRDATARHEEVSDQLTVLAELGIHLPVGGQPTVGSKVPAGTQPPDGGRLNVSAMPAAPEPCHAPPRLPLLAPLPQLSSNDAHIALLLAFELAEAQATHAALAPLRELALSARYQENGARTTVQLGLASGRPEASMEFRWRDVATHAWSVGVSATLRLDDSMGAALSTAQAAVTSAAAALALFEAGFSAAITESEAVLASAYQELAFAEEARAIATERSKLARTEREKSRGEQARLRALDAYERAYQSYLRAVNNHLSQFGLAWAELEAP